MGRRLLTVLTLFAMLAAPAVSRADGVPIILNPEDSTVNHFESDPAGAIHAARELIAQGKMNEAIKRLETYVFVHPRELAPRRFLGDLYFHSGQVDRAKFVYEEILKTAVADKETHNRLGTVYAVQNDIPDAIKEFEAALPGTDSVPDLVELHERHGDLPAYRAQMQRLAEAYPTDPTIQAELGQVYNAILQPYAASVYFRRALDNDQHSLTALNGYGLALLKMYNYDGAVREFKACLVLDPASYECEDNLGAAELQWRHFGEAKEALDRAYIIAPEHGETLVNYGFLADAQGQWQKALSYYASAIVLWPYLREAYIDLAITYEEHDMYPLAKAALLKGIASVPDDGRMHELLGQAYEAQGDRDDAIAQFRAAVRGPDPEAVRVAQAQFAKLGVTQPPAQNPQQ